MSPIETQLLRLVDRVDPQRLASDPTLTRGALKDLFPDDPLIVSLLNAAVEHGVLAALADDDRVPLTVLGPRLANQLRRDSGISSTSARWAVGAWAAALGRLPRPLPDLPREGTQGDPDDVFTVPVPEAVSKREGERAVRPAPGATDDVETLVRPETPAPEAEADAATRLIEPAPVELPADARPAADTTQLDPTTAATVLAPPAAATVHAAVTPPPAMSAPAAVASAPAERSPRRRRLLVGAAGVLVLVLAAAAVSALVLRPTPALAVAGDPHGAAWTVDGRVAAVAAGATPPKDATVEVRSGTLELRAGASVLRLAAGARARMNGPDDVTVLSGRAFTLVDGTALTVRSSAGTASVSSGRALVGCTVSACSVTALESGTVIRTGSRSTSLRPLERVGSGTPIVTLADAIRTDPWFASNDAADRRQKRTPLGVAGPALTGSWLVSLTRADLPFALARTVTLSSACDALGCTLTAATRVSDGVPVSRLTGTVRALTADGSRLAISYGSHSVRCHWVVGTKKGQGVDGTETVTDELDFHGTGASESVTGTRTTRYSAHGTACSTASFTSAKTTTLSGRRATVAQLTDAAQSRRWSEQQAKLNYVADEGTGCRTATGAPTADLVSDQRCSYTAKGSAPTSVEFAVYGSSSGLGAAYRKTTSGLVPADTGNCAVGPCEGVAPNHHGRFLLTTDARGALLITYDPRAANLLIIVRGPTMEGLSTWWSAQQTTHSVYDGFPIPRVGV